MAVPPHLGHDTQRMIGMHLYEIHRQHGGVPFKDLYRLRRSHGEKMERSVGTNHLPPLFHEPHRVELVSVLYKVEIERFVHEIVSPQSRKVGKGM